MFVTVVAGVLRLESQRGEEGEEGVKGKKKHRESSRPRTRKRALVPYKNEKGSIRGARGKWELLHKSGGKGKRKQGTDGREAKTRGSVRGRGRDLHRKSNSIWCSKDGWLI